MTPNSFREGYRCKHCPRPSSIAAGQKFADNVAERGYKLKGEYKDSRTKCLIECHREHDWYVRRDVFNRGAECPPCVIIQTRLNEQQRFADEVKAVGYTLIGDYVGVFTHTTLLCPKGDIWITTPQNFRSKRRCGVCARNNPEKSKLAFYDLVAKEGYTLVGEYITSHKCVDAICPKKHECTIITANFKRGARCMTCSGSCPVVAEQEFLQALEKEGYKALTPYIHSFKKKSSCYVKTFMNGELRRGILRAVKDVDIALVICHFSNKLYWMRLKHLVIKVAKENTRLTNYRVDIMIDILLPSMVLNFYSKSMVDSISKL